MIKRGRTPAFAAGLIILLFAAFVSCSKSGWQGTITREGDVTVVSNPREPLYSTPVLELEEDYVIGGKDAGEESGLAGPTDLAVDDAGNVFVADGQGRNVKVFSGKGEYTRTIGGPGRGPGEFQFPRGVSIAREIGELVVFDVSDVSIFSLDGAFIKRFPLKMIPVQVQADRRGNLFVATESIAAHEVTVEKFAPDMSGAPKFIFKFPDHVGEPVFAPRVWGRLDDKDRVVFGDPKTYEIRFLDAEGKLLRKIMRDHDPALVTQAEKDDLAERTRKVLGPGAAQEMVFSQFHSAFRSFFGDDEGHLFVQTWERTDDGKADIIDVFDSEGRFIGRVPMPVHPDFQAPTPRVMKGRKLYAIEPDEEGYDVVKRYSVTWKVE
jgi:hypothetical protein